MEDKVMVNNTEDFYRIFFDVFTLYKENISNDWNVWCSWKEYRYEVTNECGSGYIHKITLRNGIEIRMGDMYLKRGIRIYHKTKDPVFEVIYCMVGSINHFEEGVGTFSLNEGCFGIFMKNKAKDWIEYPKDTVIKYISVTVNFPFMIQPISYAYKALMYFKLFKHSYASFIESFSCAHKQKSNNYYTGMSNEKIENLIMKPQQIPPALKSSFEQIRSCKYLCITKLIYMECKAMEIISIALEKEVRKAMEIISITLKKEVLEHNNINKKVIIKSSDKHRIHLAEKIIINNIAEPISIKELSKKTGLNTYKLKVGFKELYGTTIFRYLKDVRLEKARDLLLNNDEMNVTEIANEVGYSNLSHFARAFRNKYGANPRDFRVRS
ncbi:helix-turn-helix transcriptional regulator [Clostridium formicaceticum]|uniref:Regulatory protein PchR n=1 Tax=Clostridium formicaceticum TaxID=1497 RepID=A0AAC9WFH6_9CLOT|nr:AraC family transcriptional regulator [Clostridium formicaceticum]AOY76525.1 hypothetical protein BJL90_12040 [Clostridium formicaceticum]ARE86937.1 Regulatory protein PchR [Clostridium formicaceticum]